MAYRIVRDEEVGRIVSLSTFLEAVAVVGDAIRTLTLGRTGGRVSHDVLLMRRDAAGVGVGACRDRLCCPRPRRRKFSSDPGSGGTKNFIGQGRHDLRGY